MKKPIVLSLILFLTAGILGCASLKSIVQPHSQVRTETMFLLPAYSGPKAKIVIADFDLKAAKAGVDIGAGLREMLVNGLISSNRFLLAERQAANNEKKETSDLIISVTVNEFEPQSSGGSAGIGGGGGAGSGALGGLLGPSLNKAHMSLDVRIIDSSSSEVLSSTRVQGQAAEMNSNVVISGSWPLGQGLTVYANTSMEKAIRVCIFETARYISASVPGKYYKY